MEYYFIDQTYLYLNVEHTNMYFQTYSRHAYHELDDEALEPGHHITHKVLVAEDGALTRLQLEVQELDKVSDLCPGRVLHSTVAVWTEQQQTSIFIFIQSSINDEALKFDVEVM